MSSKEIHAAKFKGRGKTLEQRRRARQETAIELRKNKREDQLSKRRNIVVNSDDDLEADTPPVINEALSIGVSDSNNKENNHNQVSQESNSIDKRPTPIMSLDKIITGVQSNVELMSQQKKIPDFTQLHECVQHCRKMLSREKQPPIDTIIKSGLVPYLSDLLQLDIIIQSYCTADPAVNNLGPKEEEIIIQTIFEAAWALTNICSGNSNQTHAVVHAGAIPKFVRLLANTTHLNIVEQAAWAIGNIAGDGPELRDKVLEGGVLDPLLKLIDLPNVSLGFLQNTTWTISNLCRNKEPPTELSYVNEILPSLVKLLGHTDRQIKTDAGWAMSYLTDGTNDRIDMVLHHNSLPVLIHLLSNSEDLSVLTPVLRTVGNIVTGTDQQTQAVIDTGALASFQRLLNHPKQSIQKEAAWTLSNITAGTASQIQSVIDANLLAPIVKCLAEGDFRTQKESVWVVTNFTSGGTPEQIHNLCSTGVIKCLCDLLTCNDERIVQVLLDGIQNILIHAEKLGCLVEAIDLIEECEGLDKIEQLQNSANEDVYRTAYRLIDQYFGEEEENDGGVVLDNGIGVNGEFQFDIEEQGGSGVINF